jgi:hypothetical protein
MTYEDVRIEAPSEVRFSTCFSHFFQARFSTTISTEASTQIPLFLTVLGEKEDPAGARQSTKSTHTE